MSGSSSTSTITQIVTNLNSPVMHFNQTTCLGTTDTLYYNNCNKLTFERHPLTGNNCFEPTTHTTRFIEGIGGPFYQKFVANAPNFQDDYILQYYLKQSGSCGNLYITGINESNVFFKTIYIFPNPANTNITINSAEEYSHFDVLDINGQVCNYGPLKNGTEININNLKTGVYFLHVYTKDYQVRTLKFVRE